MIKKNILIAAIVAAIAIPTAAYAISPLFINTTIDEQLPVAMENGGSMMDSESGGMMNETGAEMMRNNKMSEGQISGSFIGIGDGIHNAAGGVRVIDLDEGNRVLRLEEFSATNGPDLHVYLSSDKGASEFIDLGTLKANNGNQNYSIPEDTDLSKYSVVLIWCKQFSVLFGSAELKSA